MRIRILRRVSAAVSTTAILLAVALQAAAPLAGPERLRDLIQLPQVSVSFGFGLRGNSSSFSPELMLAEEDLEHRLAAVQKKLRDSPNSIDLQLRVRDLNRMLDKDDSADAINEVLLKKLRGMALDKSSSPALVAQFSNVLLDANHYEIAESLLRGAVEAQSSSQILWIELGQLLNRKAHRDLARDGERELSYSSPEDRVIALRKLPSITPLYREAVSCLDRAIKLDNEKNHVLATRSMMVLNHIILNDTLTEHRPNHYPGLDSTEGESALRDFSHWAEQNDDSLEALQVLTVYLYLKEAAVLREKMSWSVMDDWSQDRIRWIMSRLEELERHSDPMIAAAAYEHHAMIAMMIQPDEETISTTGIRYLERAYALAPARQATCQVLVGINVVAEEYQKAASIAEQLLKSFPSDKNALIYAKVMFELERYDEASSTIERGLTQWPDSPWLLLSKVAQHLKTCSAEEHPSLAPLVKKIYGLIKPDGESEKKEETGALMNLRMSYFKTAAILNGLTGEYEEALKFAENAVKIDPSDKNAKAIKSALR